MREMVRGAPHVEWWASGEVWQIVNDSCRFYLSLSFELNYFIRNNFFFKKKLYQNSSFFSSINRDLVCLIWTQKKIPSFSLSFNLSISLCFEMDPNNYHFNTQNSSNYTFSYQNPNNYQDPNQISNYQNPNNYQDPNQFPNQRPQNIQNFGMPPNFNRSSSVPNFHPYYGAMMRFPSPPFNGYMPNKCLMF